MILVILTGNKINKLTLPDQVDGNYIVKDYRNNIIGNLFADSGKWVFNVGQGYIGGNGAASFSVEMYQEFRVKHIKTDNTVFLYLYQTSLNGVAQKKIKGNTISIGKSGDISYSSDMVRGNHAKMSKINGLWYIEAIDNAPVYVNNRLVRRKRVDHGDIVFIYGLKFCIISDFIIIQSVNRFAQITLSGSCFENYMPISQEVKDDSLNLEGDYETFTYEEQFMRSPRFRSNIKAEEIKITPPKEKEKDDTKPGILQIGPRLTMALSSVVGILTSLNNIAIGKAELSTSLLPLLVSVVVLVSSFFWPALTMRFNKHEKRKKEITRVRMYKKYLDRKSKEISEKVELQKQILLENNLSLEECQMIIYNRRRNLWERTISDDDFLQVRLGIGKVKPELGLSYNEDDFDIEDDLLREEMKDMLKKYEYMEDMPLNLPLTHNYITAVIGNYALLYRFMQSLLLQIMTLHIYSELKICIFTDEEKVSDWDYMKFAPHCWDNPHERRFIAATVEEKKQLSSYLENVLGSRMGSEDEDVYKNFNSYYLVICDNIDNCRELGAFKMMTEASTNIGFTLLIKNDRIANLPRQCTTFINVTEETSGVFETNLSEDNQKQFKADFNKTINMEECVQKLSNIYIEVPKEKFDLPKSIGFLEMYEVGNVDQLNSALRWKGNNPVVSIAVPVGIDQSGNVFYMDIHEKAYGPHGLVAGTTGSGKSEWLITYILSLAVNFSPLEVQFVLIDYKGGGLAGSFENTETGMALPHLVGTITNLDKSEIRRSIASLTSESKRRQRMFNEARDKLDDSSMDIYKYQKYFRKGLVDEPLSHLIIISDEFAELKSQEPEFLDSLVSIARVGRSLGIHLILATQKPAGVVTDQIWSNSRFKVCLRVQDTADSKDMIKCDDAAFLKQTGSFYLQVGMNEVFTSGQSAYAGLKYSPTNVVKKKIDIALEEVDRSGAITNSHAIIEENTSAEAHGEELLNIVKYLDDTAAKQHLVAKKLWLTAIPPIIYIDKLKKKYNFEREKYHPIPVVGEYDDPTGQKQDAFSIDITKSNIFIYGMGGSGKEMMIQSLIYSLITSYTTHEINIYIGDFGAETLGIFEDAPHVGGVVFASELERFKDMLKLIQKELVRRRKKYREFGGQYEKNIKYGKEKDPIMLVVINGFEFFKDDYPEIRDQIEKMAMDSSKYGIIFLLSTIDKTCVRTRTLNNFSNVFLLHLNDDVEYRDLLGQEARGIIPKNEKGRGLFKQDDNVYEFQAGTIVSEDEFQTKLKLLCEKLNDYYEVKCPPIPSIPNPINIDTIPHDDLSVTKICGGYLKTTLEPYWFNLKQVFSLLISANKKQSSNDYIKIMLEQLDLISDATVYAFDPNSNHKALGFNNIKYFGGEEVKDNLYALCDIIEQEYTTYDASSDKKNYVPSQNLVICLENIIAINKLYNDEEKTRLIDCINKAEECKVASFIYSDIAGDLKMDYREKLITRLLGSGYAVFLDNSQEMQMFLEVTSKDVRLKDAPADNEGYIVEAGKAYFANILKTEKVGSAEDEI